jgi:hypothetical protein
MKIFLFQKKYLAIFIICTLFACSRFPYYPIDELLSAPEQIEIDGREYVLETFLWRDFMPGPDMPPDGSSLIAIIYIVEIDSLLFPTSLDADFLWVIKDDVDEWVTELEDDETSTEDYKLRKIARDGPKWGSETEPNVLVDVVVRVVKEDGSTYLLRAADQPIVITY